MHNVLPEPVGPTAITWKICYNELYLPLDGFGEIYSAAPQCMNFWVTKLQQSLATILLLWTTMGRGFSG